MRRNVASSLPFSPGVITAELADVGIRDELTRAQLLVAATALSGAPLAALYSLRLPPVEYARAERWVRGVRDAMVDWVLGYVAGTQGYGMTAAEMWVLVRLLLSNVVPDRAPVALLALLEGINDSQLAGLFEENIPRAILFEDHPQVAGLLHDDMLAGPHTRWLRELLEEAISAEHELRPRLEELFSVRFDDEQHVRVVYPESFSAGLISEELAGVDESAMAELRPGLVGYIGEVLGREAGDQGYVSVVLDRLARLSPVQQAQAVSWLGRVRFTLRVRLAGKAGPGRPDAVGVLDEMVNRLYADAARRITDLRDLGDLTVAPPASQQDDLREVLTPAVPAAGEEARPVGFARELRGRSFGDRLRHALLEMVDEDEADLVRGKGAAERAQPGRLYSKEDIQEIADLARSWVNDVFGALVSVPRLVVAEPGQEGDIFDQFAYREWEWRSWSQETHREAARMYLLEFLNGARASTGPARVAAEHGADLSFAWPLNDETKVASEVIDRLLDNPETVRRISAIERSWQGMHEPGSGKVMLSFVREEGNDVQYPWRAIAFVLVHELMHRLESARHFRFRSSSYRGAELVTLVEGIPTLMGNMVVAYVMARLQESGDDGRTNLENWSRIILRLGSGDVTPDLDEVRHLVPPQYDALTEAMRLAARRGIGNVLVAFIGEQWWKIVGPAPGSPGSMLTPDVTVEPSPEEPSASDESSDEDGAPPPGEPGDDDASIAGSPAAPARPLTPEAADLPDQLDPSEHQQVALPTSTVGSEQVTGEAQTGTDAGGPFGTVLARRPRRRVGEGAESRLSVRLDGNAQSELRGRVIAFLGRPGAPAISGSVQDAQDQFTAVLAEVEGRAGADPGGDDWNSLVSTGLARLDRATRGPGYVAALPGVVDPANLVKGQELPVPGLIHAHADATSVTGGVRYEIESTEGRDVSGLVGSDSDLVMFDREQRFQVTDVTTVNGQLRIKLAHPSRQRRGEPGTAPSLETITIRDTGAPAAEQPEAAPASTAERTSPMPAEESLAEGSLADGWEWLDRGRGLAVPVTLPGAVPGTVTALAGWRSAVPGAGRGYAFHLDTGRVVLGDRTVIGLSDGWIPYQDGLLHRDGGFVIGADGALSVVADLPRDARMSLPRDQMNAQDLGLWLGRHGAVDDPQLAPGWVTRTDDSQSPSWRWNGGDVAPAIPAGLEMGSASGENLRCLLDTLSQLVRRTLGGDERGGVSTDGLAGWLERALPEGLQGYQQLMSSQMIDVTDVLPTFTEAFGVRVQVFEFRRQGDRTADRTFLFPQDGIYVRPPQGPEYDEAGYPTPILHVHWSYSHFVPLYTDRYPVQLVLRQPLQAARRGVPVGAVLPRPDQYQQVADEISGLLRDHPDRSGFLAANTGFEQQVSELDQQWQALYAQLHGQYNAEHAQDLRVLLVQLNSLHDHLVSWSPALPELGVDSEAADLEGAGAAPGSALDQIEAYRDAAAIALGPGWEWLDWARGLAVPTGVTGTEQADWLAAEPGQGRGYAVHLPSGMVAVAREPGASPAHTVHDVSGGWVRHGSDLLHRTDGVALYGPDARIGGVNPEWLADPATQADLEGMASLSHDDLLIWLARHGGLAGARAAITGAGLPAEFVVPETITPPDSSTPSEDSRQSRGQRSIAYNGSPVRSTDSPVPSWAAFAEPVDRYLAALPLGADWEARQQLSAVLAEAQAQADGQPAMAGAAWREMVDRGLALVLPAGSQWGYAAALPDAVPDGLRPGASFTIETPALAYVSAGSVPGGGYLFEIERPDALDIARLAGDESGRMMFAAGTPFVVMGHLRA